MAPAQLLGHFLSNLRKCDRNNPVAFDLTLLGWAFRCATVKGLNPELFGIIATGGVHRAKEAQRITTTLSLMAQRIMDGLIKRLMRPVIDKIVPPPRTPSPLQLARLGQGMCAKDQPCMHSYATHPLNFYIMR